MHAAILLLAVTTATANPDSSDRYTGAYIGDAQLTDTSEPPRWDDPQAEPLRHSTQSDTNKASRRTAPPARMVPPKAGVRSAEFRVNANEGEVRQAQYSQELVPVNDERARQVSSLPSNVNQGSAAAPNRGGLYIPPSVEGMIETTTTGTAPPTAQHNSTQYDPYGDLQPAVRDPRREATRTPAAPAQRPAGQESWNYVNVNDVGANGDPNPRVPYDPRTIAAPTDPRNPNISRQRMAAHVANQRPADGSRNVVGTAPGTTEFAAQPTDTNVAARQTPPLATETAIPTGNRDPYGATRPNTTSTGSPILTENAAKAPKAGTYFFTLLALFASIGMNLYLGWIAWDTYNRYQDLVADMRHATTRRERPDRGERDERDPPPRRGRRLAEAY